jgi:hypothetical protein
LNLPAGNTFLRIEGNSGKNVTANTATNVAQMTTASNATTIFYLTSDKELISYSNGLGLYWTHAFAAPANASLLNTFTFTEGGGTGTYTIQSNASTVHSPSVVAEYFSDGGESSLGRVASVSSPTTDWTLTEINKLPVTISSAGYATFCSPVAVTIPAGVTAYVGTRDHRDYLHLEAIEGGIIPANQGVILKGEPGTYDFNLTTGGSVDENLLTGTVAAIDRPASSYVLSNGTYGLGLYQDGATTIPGFKAYLRPAVVGVKGFMGFSFDDVDAIENIVKQIPTNDEYYDLSGRRVSKPTKGMYIINGKKALVK